MAAKLKITKGMKTFLIIAALAVAAYFLYEWYVNRQNGTTGGSLGANLNSVAPEMVSGSTGPNSGLTYNQGSTYVYLTETGTNSATSSKTPATGTKIPVVHGPIESFPIFKPGVKTA